MRILLQNSTFYPRTADHDGEAVLLLARALSERGHHVDVLATTGRREGPARQLARRNVDGVSGAIFEAPAHGFGSLRIADECTRPSRFWLPRRALHRWTGGGSPRWRRLVHQLVEAERPDLLHTHSLTGMTPSVWKAATALGVPIVHSLRDGALLESRAGRTGRVQLVTANSRFELQRHLEGGWFRGSRTEVLASPAHPLIEPMPLRDLPRVPRALCLGPLTSERGVELVLEVLRRWFEDRDSPPLTFTFAGSGPLEDRVRRFCSSWSKRATLCGDIEGTAKDRLLRESDMVIVVPTADAPVECTMLDAFRYALPVIGSKRGGIAEWVEHERTGTLVAPEPDALGSALRAYVEQPARRHAHGAAAHAVAARNRLDAYVDRVIAGYESLTVELTR